MCNLWSMLYYGACCCRVRLSLCLHLSILMPIFALFSAFSGSCGYTEREEVGE